MLNDAQSSFQDAPWLALVAGVLITLTVASVNFVGKVCATPSTHAAGSEATGSRS